MRRVMLSSLCGFFLCLQAGCSIRPLHYEFVDAKGLQNRSGIRLMDIEDVPDSVKASQNGDLDQNLRWGVSGRISQGKPCRVKYHKLYSTNGFMVVEGEVSAGQKYPVLLDTGASRSLFIKDIHVLHNNLPIYPVETDKADSKDYNWGLSHLPKLCIGGLTFTDSPCFYLARHLESKLFGLLSVSRDDSIIVGLPALREFKYVVFDGIREEVEFSLEIVFECGGPDLWVKYPFTIDEDLAGNAFLFVKIPIAGELTKLQLDTGSGRGLAVDEALWGVLCQRIQGVKLSKAKDLYPYIGWLECGRGIISELSVGDRIVKDAQISVFPDDSPLLGQCQGLVGMQYFQDTVLVLDFERNLMWVRGLQGERSSSSDIERG